MPTVAEASRLRSLQVSAAGAVVVDHSAEVADSRLQRLLTSAAAVTLVAATSVAEEVTSAEEVISVEVVTPVVVISAVGTLAEVIPAVDTADITTK